MLIVERYFFRDFQTLCMQRKSLLKLIIHYPCEIQFIFCQSLHVSRRLSLWFTKPTKVNLVWIAIVIFHTHLTFYGWCFRLVLEKRLHFVDDKSENDIAISVQISFFLLTPCNVVKYLSGLKIPEKWNKNKKVSHMMGSKNANPIFCPIFRAKIALLIFHTKIRVWPQCEVVFKVKMMHFWVQQQIGHKNPRLWFSRHCRRGVVRIFLR